MAFFHGTTIKGGLKTLKREILSTEASTHTRDLTGRRLWNRLRVHLQGGAGWFPEVRTFTLKKGSLLYGTYPSPCTDLDARYDKETGKHGKYFSTGKYIPLGMVLEYDQSANLCTFEVLEDIQCYYGKYSFRQLEPSRYYESAEHARSGKFKLNVDPEKSYNHIDDSLLPIHDLFQNNFKLWEGTESEVFLTKESLEKVTKIAGQPITVNEAKKEVEERLGHLAVQYANNLKSNPQRFCENIR